MERTQEKQLILATRNPYKVKEIENLLLDHYFNVITLESFPDIPEVIEDGKTIEANAEKKARAIFNATGILSIADDTALEVDFLNGGPGVYSSRFAGKEATYEMNNDKLLRLLKNVPWDERKANFRCVIAIMNSNSGLKLLEGVCHGYILEERRGQNGFGYDPLFFVPEFQLTLAEMPLPLKNQISHRSKALQKVRKYFEKIA